MTELEAAKELQVRVGELRMYFASSQRRRQPIARQRRPPAVEQKRVAVTSALTQEGEEHVLVVAAQEHGLTAPGISQRHQQIDDPTRVRTAVDVVAEKDDLVVRSRSDGVEDDAQLVDAAMNVAHGEEAAW